MELKEIYNTCMPLEKRRKERMNIWVAWVVRPLSVIMTIPFIHTKVKPSDITIVSILFSLAGFALFVIGKDDMSLKMAGWLCFFVWAILDGVDGNLARCQHTASDLGELWDAVGGYACMVLIYLSAGIAAFHDVSSFEIGENYYFILLGGLNAVIAIFPRLIMHKKHNTMHHESQLNKKESFGIKQIIAMNVISVSGFMQVIFLFCIFFHLLNIFTILYFVVNTAIMILSLRTLLR